MSIYINGQLQVDGISPTFDDVTISGDLTVNGTTTTINSTTFEATELILTPTSGEGLTVRESDDGNDAIRLKGFGAAGQLNVLSAGVNTIQLSGNGDSFFTGGNVGIGTNSPSVPLDVNGAVSIAGTADFGGVLTIDNNTYIKWKDSGSSGRNILTLDNSDVLTIKNPVGDIFFDTSGGNIGIGTNSPNQKLTISGTDQYVATQHTTYPWGGTNTIGLRMGTDGTAGVLDFRRWTGTSTNHGAALITQLNSDGGYGLDFRVDTKSTNTSATTSRMFLSNSGNVGIGTTSPNSLLDIAGDQADMFQLDRTANAAVNDVFGINIGGIGDGNLIIRDITANINIASFNSTGNVGIGTTSPDYSLHLSRSDTSEIFGITNSGTGGGTIEQGVSNDSFGIGGNKYYFTTSTAASAYLVMDLNDGNVGIGTTSPGAKLAVKTTEAVDALFINKDNFGSVLVIDQDVNSANACYGVEMNIANTGAGLEYAFRFDGSEIVGSAVGGSQDKKVRVNIAGTDYFIPLHTA